MKNFRKLLLIFLKTNTGEEMSGVLIKNGYSRSIMIKSCNNDTYVARFASQMSIENDLQNIVNFSDWNRRLFLQYPDD